MKLLIYLPSEATFSASYKVKVTNIAKTVNRKYNSLNAYLEFKNINHHVKSEKIQTQTLIDDMIKTMYSNNGIGLAGVQVGKLLRIVVLDVEQKENSEKKPQIFINPEIVYYSPEFVL